MKIEFTDKEISFLQVLLSQGITVQHGPKGSGRESIEIYDSINNKLKGE